MGNLKGLNFIVRSIFIRKKFFYPKCFKETLSKLILNPTEKQINLQILRKFILISKGKCCNFQHTLYVSVQNKEAEFLF